LGDNFGLDDGVVEALLRLGIGSLQEFCFLWASEQAIETWIGKLGLGDKALLMMARVRRAWAAVGLYYRQVEQGRSKIVALSDLDTMLGETELRDTKQQFWRRYKMRFPPGVRPADATISRVASGERVASSWIRLWGLSTTTSTSHWHAGSVGGLGRTQPEDP